jgi:hypothetical protein
MQEGYLEPGQEAVNYISAPSTRWNYVLHMFERYVRLQPHLLRLLLQIEKKKEAALDGLAEVLLTEEDVKKVQQSLPVRSYSFSISFYQIWQQIQIFILCVEKSTFTIGELPALVDRLITELRPKEKEKKFTVRVRATALRNAEYYFREIFTSASLPLRAATMHPRYASLPWVTPEVRNAVWHAVTDDAEALFVPGADKQVHLLERDKETLY